MGRRPREGAKSELPDRGKREVVPSELLEADESNEIEQSADVYLQKFVNNHESGSRNRPKQLDANRITSLLDEPLDNSAATQDEAARRANSITATHVITTNDSRGETRQTILPTPNQLDQSSSQIVQQPQASHWNTSDCLLVLLIGYILWQCIFKSRKKRAKHLARLRHFREKLFPGFEQDAGELDEAEFGDQVLAGGRFALGAANRADEAIETLGEEQTTTGRKGRLVGLKRFVAKSSLVVAVGEAARPKVRIFNERMRSFVDATETKTDQWAFSRCLKSRLGGLFARPKDEPVDIELGQPEAFCLKRASQAPVGSSANSDHATIEAIVHRNDDVRSNSLVGFAGSFLEQQTPSSPAAVKDELVLTREPLLGLGSQVVSQAVNLSPNSSELPPSPSSNSHLSASLLSASSTSNNLPGGAMKLSPLHGANAGVNRNLLSACNAFESQCPLRGELLARSKSQTGSTNYLEARTNEARQRADYHAKSASPNICRPCDSASPRNQPIGLALKPSPRLAARPQAISVNYHSLLGCTGQASSCNFASSSPLSLSHSASNGRQCQSSNNNERIKHHYENYYDDECEDAYRRLTTSMGMQFRLDLDASSCAGHQQPASGTGHSLLYGQNSLATRQAQRANYQQFQQAPTCRCCSFSARFASDAPSSSGATSLGGSDSGNFSLANKLDASNSNSSCQNLGCTMCSSSAASQAPVAPGMSILVHQPSVSNTPPPPQPAAHKSVDFQAQAAATELDVSPATNGNHALVSRWNQRRRSTMSACSRSPRRMSLATVSNWPTANQTCGSTCQHGLKQSHLMHRASIASDGQRHQQHPMDRYQPYSMQSGQILCAGSQYSSSAGSSSGIGFSGSQCTNTPTTSMFPYGSFIGIGTKQAEPTLFPTSTEQLVKGPLMGLASQPQYQCCPTNYNFSQTEPAASAAAYELLPHYDPNSLSQLHLSHQLHMSGLRQPTGAQLMPLMCQGSIKPFEGSSASSRKYSLPVQLESNAAEMAERSRSPKPLFKMPPDGDDGSVLAQSQMDPLNAAAPSEDASEIPRRSSQTIARQTSFWLEDTGEDLSVALACQGRTSSNMSDLPPARPRSGSPSSRPASSATPPKSPGASAKKHNRPPSSSSSSSPASSPSPDFFGARSRAPSRPLVLGPTGGSISKRQTLAKLRSRRAKRRLSRASGSQKASADLETSSKSHSLEINSTDDDRTKGSKNSKPDGAAEAGQSSEREDSFGSSLDRDFLAAPPPTERKFRDSNSASLERQCRDLWKLRSTLHNDASFGDNWSNYHQRLNRRYDSGYKSIENQFNSSLEGNIPMPTAPTGEDIISDAFTSPDQTKLVEDQEGEKKINQPLEADLLVRPQSGCSGFVGDNQQQGSLIGRRSTTPVIDDEETQALLADCDQQRDDPSPVSDANPTES